MHEPAAILVGHRRDDPDIALARYPPGAVATRVVRALRQGAGEHVLALLDVGSAPNGDVVLVVEPLPVALRA